MSILNMPIKGNSKIRILTRLLLTRTFLWLLLVSLLGFFNNKMAKARTSQINIAYFSVDPLAIDPLSRAFDPDSYAVISQIFDPLVYLDLEGNLQPALATHWEQLSETRWKFTLRRNIQFHNGEPFNAKSVKFTFDYILNPSNNTGNRWILNSLKSTQLVKNEPYQIILETHAPDGMFLNRLHLFGSICPPDYIKKKGFKYFQQHPVGTGPFKFHHWNKQTSIQLIKNSRYWKRQQPHLDKVNFVIHPKEQWVELFLNNQVDFIPNLSGNKTRELMRKANDQVKIIKRPVLASYWVLLKNEGLLNNVNFRKALNYAINKVDIVHFSDFGNSLPLSSLGKKGEFGANENLPPYSFNREKAKELLAQENITPPIKLTALVADIAETTAYIIKNNLEKIGVELDLEIVSRTEWSNRIVVHKMKTGKRADYDLAINLVDNPTYHLAFHAGIFLDSNSPWSLLSMPEFDSRLKEALQITDKEQHKLALQALDTFIHEKALMLFTTQKIITVAIRRNFNIQEFSRSGHLNYEVLAKAKVVEE